jgi:autotransporter adhesin
VQQSVAGAPITVGAATDGAVVDFTGTAGTRKLTGVAAGALTSASTDAINGGQLYTANQRVAAAFGTTLDSNGQLNAPSYTIQGTAYDNVGSAFSAVDNAFSSLQTQISGGSIGLVQQNATTRVISVGGATDGTTVNVSGTAGDRTVTGVAAGALSAGSSDAVNGSQLYATNQQVAANTTAIANLSSVVSGLQGGGSIYVKVNSSGSNASATGVNAAAIGSGSSASGDNAMAFGTNAQATQSGAIAMGLNASSTGVNAIAIGTAASATGSVAIGNAAAAANGGAAFGDGAVATGANSAALGPNATATAANSVAIGSGSTNTVANTVSFGAAGNERRLTNVAAGTNPTDAVNVGQLQSVAAGFSSQTSGMQNQISGLQSQTDRVRDGVALALAVGGAATLQPGRKFALSTSFGNFQGSNALGIGGTALLQETQTSALTLNVGVGWGMNTNSIGTRGAVTMQW